MFSGFWCYHVVFQIVGGILALAPAHLFLHMLLGESWWLGPIFAVATCVLGGFSWSALLRSPLHWSLSDPLYPEVGCSGRSKDPADEKKCLGGQAGMG